LFINKLNTKGAIVKKCHGYIFLGNCYHIKSKILTLIHKFGYFWLKISKNQRYVIGWLERARKREVEEKRLAESARECAKRCAAVLEQLGVKRVLV